MPERPEPVTLRTCRFPLTTSRTGDFISVYPSNLVGIRAPAEKLNSRSTKQEMRMNMFEITIARIEVILPNERGEDIRLTFQFESRQTSFTLPIFLKSCEFDDTEIVRVARSQLHDVFAQLCSQCEDWQLTEDERRELARISVRPGVKAQE